MSSEHEADLVLKTRLERLLASSDPAATWSDVEKRARGMGWQPKEDRLALVPGSAARADGRFRVSTPRPGARWPVVLRRPSRARIAVFASIVVVVIAAVAIGSFVAVRSLTRPGFVLAITDETVMKPGGAGQTVAAPEQWEHLPLTTDGGYVVFMVMNQDNPSVLYAAVEDGLYKSEDAAESWERLEGAPPRPYLLVLDPATTTLYLISGNPDLDRPHLTDAHHGLLWRSDDGGVTWKNLSASAPDLAVWPPILWVDDSTSPSTVYAYDVGWNLCRSIDRGENWTTLTEAEAAQVPWFEPEPEGSQFHGIVTDADTGVVFARSEYAQIQGPIDPHDPSIQYAGTPEGVYKSTDSGETWRKASRGMTTAAVWKLVPDPSSAEVLYASTPDGIYKTTNAGKTWEMILAGQGVVVVAPSSPSTLYAWTSAGLFRSSDGGGHWTRLKGTGLIPSPQQWSPNPRLISDGLILVAPGNPDTVFAATNALFRSTDGGDTWNRVPYADGVVGAQAGPGMLYAVTYTGGWVASGGAANQISRSADMGDTWETVSPKEWEGEVQEVAVDPHVPSNIYVTHTTETGWNSLSRSTNGGATWEEVPLEGAGKYFDLLRFDPHSASTLYVLTSRPLAAGPQSDLYRSTDGGGTWEDITGYLTGISDIVVDPAPDGALYVLADGGLFKWRGMDTGAGQAATGWAAPTLEQGLLTVSAEGHWGELPEPRIPGFESLTFLARRGYGS